MTVLAQIKSKIAKAFDNIGKVNGTAVPHTDDNRFPLAYEYFVADQLASIANKRKEAAKEACVQAGMLSHAATEGNTEVVYDGELLSISAKTANAAERLDKTQLSNALTRELGASKAQQFIKNATTKSKPAVTFIFGTK